MPIRVEIQCINKTNRQDPHARIANVGGVHDGQRWKMTVSQAIAGIKNGDYDFWTRGGGKTARVLIAQHDGHEYLRA
jgi:hypothetical protein